MSAHYVIICDHVFTSLEVFFGGRGGQCRWYLQRMFSKDSERRKKGIKGVSFRYILDFFSRVYLEFPCESALWPSDGDLLQIYLNRTVLHWTRCACQSRLSLFFYFNFCCPGADIAMSKIGLFLKALGVLAAVTFTLWNLWVVYDPHTRCQKLT